MVFLVVLVRSDWNFRDIIVYFPV